MKFFCWSCKTYLFYMNQRSQSKMVLLTFKYRTSSKWINFQGRSGTQLPTYLDKVPILLDFPDLIRSIVDRLLGDISCATRQKGMPIMKA